MMVSAASLRLGEDTGKPRARIRLRRAELEDARRMAYIKLANANPFSRIAEGLHVDDSSFRDHAMTVHVPEEAILSQMEDIRARLALSSTNALITVAVLREEDNNDGEVVVGWAMWRLFDNEPQSREQEPVLPMPEEAGESLIRLRKKCIHAFKTGLVKGRNEHMLGKRNIRLSNLFTHPLHHRKGVGSALLQQGTSIADSKGIVSYVEASPMGKTLYEKHGYVEVGSFTLDLNKYRSGSFEEAGGGDEDVGQKIGSSEMNLYKTTLMVREPILSA